MISPSCFLVEAIALVAAIIRKHLSWAFSLVTEWVWLVGFRPFVNFQLLFHVRLVTDESLRWSLLYFILMREWVSIGSWHVVRICNNYFLFCEPFLDSVGAVDLFGPIRVVWTSTDIFELLSSFDKVANVCLSIAFIHASCYVGNSIWATFLNIHILVGRWNKVFRLDVLCNKVVVLDSGPIWWWRRILAIPKCIQNLTIELANMILFHGKRRIETLTWVDHLTNWWQLVPGATLGCL